MTCDCLPAEEAIKAAAGSRAFIISGERLSTLPPQKVREELHSCFGDLSSKITVIHYVRPHFGRAISAYAEQVKIGATALPLDGFIKRSMKNGRFRHTLKIEAWRKEFQDGYILRPMQRSALHQGDVVADFFLTALGELSDGWTPPPHALGYEFERHFSAVEGGRTAPLRMGCDLARMFFDRHEEDAKAGDAHLAPPILEEALHQGLQAESQAGVSEFEPRHAKQADEIISRLLDLADTADEWELALQIRRARFKRYIETARPASRVEQRGRWSGIAGAFRRAKSA